MASLGEEELVRMVQDFIESESTPPTINSNSSNFHRTQYFILQDILRSSETEAESKILNCVMKHMRSRQVGCEKTSSNLKRWLLKRLKMDGFNASLIRTSWPTSLACPAGEYEYIEVVVGEDGKKGKKKNEVRVIVDIDFRSQFELARPTEYYKELTESLPVVFVGSEKKVCKIISLMCCAAKKSLREKGLHVPPWRTTTYMQSKWLCRSSSGATNNSGDVYGNWVPPTVRPRRRDLDGGGGSALSSQFSNMGINCCYV
ncbi:hypothetical protein PIB30_012874 [Stylosanthes scabra]|uniref:Uncharacterized protein n=1 Tax=Stylosanthes scabra TaxID=79078 RepID=A0ABU6W4K4_9FABA|nr:hypothetical protein [Stylosanthes scabra]